MYFRAVRTSSFGACGHETSVFCAWLFHPVLESTFPSIELPDELVPQALRISTVSFLNLKVQLISADPSMNPTEVQPAETLRRLGSR